LKLSGLTHADSVELKEPKDKERVEKADVLENFR